MRSFFDVIDAVRPRAFICENVKALAVLTKWEAVRQELMARANESYHATLVVVNASHFGVPQNRERLFAVAYHGAFDFPTPTHRRGSVTAGEALGDLAHTIPKGSKFLTPSMDAYVARYEKASKCIRPRDLHPAGRCGQDGLPRDDPRPRSWGALPVEQEPRADPDEHSRGRRRGDPPARRTGRRRSHLANGCAARK